ncbi:MAG: GGDEF domain-containing protein [Thiohalomonadaceae bacterium]
MISQGLLNTSHKSTVAKVVSLAHAADTPDRLRLITALQTTLDLQQMLHIFSTSMQTLVPHQGLSYRHHGHNISHDVCMVNARHHQCTYHLNLPDSELGELSISRDTQFSEQELAQFESLLDTLVYPLRNALHYHEARLSAHRDHLTGVPNRAALDEQLQREVTHAQRHQQALSLLVIDIDRFKKINDRHGHLAGDMVLRSVAQLIKKGLREDDLLFRYGGEEFVALLQATSTDGAAIVAERIRSLINAAICTYGDKTIKVTVSIGMATLARESSDKLFERADQALYTAKQQGRNQVQVA